MTDENIPIEHELVRAGLMFDEIEVRDTKITPTVGNEDLHVRIALQTEEDLVPAGGLALIYVLALLSFTDARPRGVSGHWYEDDDQFTAGDLLRHLTFEHGKLHLYVDYLRGRCVKTSIDVSSDGQVILETVNRGQAATRWIDRIKGKSFLKPVGQA